MTLKATPQMVHKMMRWPISQWRRIAHQCNRLNWTYSTWMREAARLLLETQEEEEKQG